MLLWERSVAVAHCQLTATDLWTCIAYCTPAGLQHALCHHPAVGRRPLIGCRWPCDLCALALIHTLYVCVYVCLSVWVAGCIRCLSSWGWPLSSRDQIPSFFHDELYKCLYTHHMTAVMLNRINKSALMPQRRNVCVCHYILFSLIMTSTFDLWPSKLF